MFPSEERLIKTVIYPGLGGAGVFLCGCKRLITKLPDFNRDPTRTLVWATHDREQFYIVFNEEKSDLWIGELREGSN